MQGDSSGDAPAAMEIFAKEKIRSFFLQVYRPRCLRMLARLFASRVPTMQVARTMSLAQVSEKIKSKLAGDAASRFVKRIIALVNSLNRAQPVITGDVHAKILLASYMIALHPEHVFEIEDNLSRELKDATAPMIESLEACVQLFATGVPWQEIRNDQGRELRVLLSRYLRTFKAWKIVDERRLADRIKQALRALEMSTGDDGRGIQPTQQQAPQHIVQNVRTQIARLREQLVMIAGQAELEAYDRMRATERQAQQQQRLLRGASQFMDGQCVAAGMNNEQLAHELLLRPDFYLCADSWQQSSAGASSSAPTTTTTPQTVITRIRKTFEDSFWSNMHAELSRAPSAGGRREDTRLLSVIHDFHFWIKSFCKDFPEELVKVQRVYELFRDFARTAMSSTSGDQGSEKSGERGMQLLTTAMSLTVDLFHTVTQKMRHTPVAGRDATFVGETLAHWDSLHQKLRERVEATGAETGESAVTGAAMTDFPASLVCDCMRFKAHLLYTLRVDMANAKLAAIAPYIALHGIEYARTHVERNLATGRLSLSSTDAWIRHVMRRTLARKDSRVSLQALDGSAPSADFYALLRIAFVDLVAEYPHWGGVKRTDPVEIDKSLPVTLRLDCLRVRALNAHLHTDVMCAIVIKTLEPFLAGAVDEMDRVVDMLIQRPPLPFEAVEIMGRIGTQLASHAALETILAQLKERLVRTSNEYCAMLALFKARWYDILHVNQGLVAPVPPPPPAVAVLPQHLTDLGLPARLLESMDRHATGDFLAMFRINLLVHQQTYLNVIGAAKDAVQPRQNA